ncbi:MAG: serine hydrolase domain-containing protein [Thermoanaerobaculia bacterium]|nr:serine hydrolase domain-containing protein [Thermoanaerobaculia bacterium]
MRNPRLAPFWALLAVVFVVATATSCAPTVQADADVAAPSRDLSAATPEDVGMSSARLERLSAAMQELVDEGELAGIATVVARRGRTVHSSTHGHQNLESGTPMALDSIFRIHSMTKPITGVALMMLYEEGAFRLSDPVGRHIPELADLKVWAGPGKVEEPDHPMTVRELMSHSGGLTYGLFSQSEVDQMYTDANILDRNSTLDEMIDKLAAIPLMHQPGTRWHYSVAVDVQGYLVEVLSGQPFDAFLEERIFEPLAMHDTGFVVPQEKADRIAQIYAYAEDRSLVPHTGLGANDPLEDAAFKSGGGGLLSTPRDYLRFSQMLLNGGELDGVRILSPLTVDLMHRNHLPREAAEMAPGTGFGLDFAVVLDPVEADGVSAGEYYWSGLAGCWFWIDPVEDLVFVGMIQQMGRGRPNIRSLSHRLTYQAILDPVGI